MNKTILIILFMFISTSCKNLKGVTENTVLSQKFTIAFGSCNKLSIENTLWDDVLKAQPDLWIWGGDIVYADTEDISKIKLKYETLKKVKAYQKLYKNTAVIGSWDDHDYGINDGGTEFAVKKESQHAFLDFMDVTADSPRRGRDGIYATHVYKIGQSTIRVLVLDTRYFRTPLTANEDADKRFKPNKFGQGTILGAQQWNWLERQLEHSKADFNILVSSIQFLSNQHGFETWGNFPHEVERLKNAIVSSGAKGLIILSGDRHISEFSRTTLADYPYPLVDFTSSGLTHAFSDFSGETNPFRVGEVVHTESFGLISLQMGSGEVLFQMIGEGGEILGELNQKYK